MIRTLIVDDERHAREELEVLLLELGDIEIVGTCANAMEAVKAINHERPELIFLDIKMPVIDGFTLLGMIEEEIMPYVVFVTAFDEYALKAFDEKTLDYLLKPVDPQRLAQTMKKVHGALDNNEKPALPQAQINRIPCTSVNHIKLVDPQDVEYVHSDISGVHVFTAEGNYFSELTLKVLEGRAGLLRCHKQYLINPAKVDEIIPLENGMAEIKTIAGARLPVSRRCLQQVKAAFGLK
ncbi:MAG: two-component system response regulator YehT [Desulfuromonas sp.]|nr:MAG: two-component system response regulator YehT [Desulfuromonas sp.]